MSHITIILKDKSSFSIDRGATALDLAFALSKGLAKRVIAAQVNGELRDIQDPLHDHDEVILLEEDAPVAKEIISHSCEHLLAAALVDIFPGAQISMGPKDHSESFYYDFDIGRPITENDLAVIETKMGQLVKEGITFKKRWVSKSEAKEIFLGLGQHYKLEILDWIDGDQVTLYESGRFIDLCRGPHVPNSKFIKAFKLLGTSGSYWRADASQKMLQRITGVAFTSKAELDAYLFRIEEAKKRDHRKLGPALDLFFVSERFESFCDREKTNSEIRILITPSAQLVANLGLGGLMGKIEGMVHALGQKSLGRLDLSSINIAKPADAAKSEVDIRVFASSQDSSLRVLCVDAIKAMESEDLGFKLTFDTKAQEDIGPGLVMWLPKGGRLRSIIEDFSRKRHFDHAYEMVCSPHIARSDLWRISGHLGFYKDSMFAPMNVDGNEYMLKPMNCPFHILMYKFKPHSYRDLPLRLAEFGTVYRYELAGALHGLMRVRGFTQDDAHIFCTWDQLNEELDKVLQFVLAMLKAFGFQDFSMNLSTRPEKYVGEKADWDRAEASLKSTIERSGFSYAVDEGGGAFYGPKIDVKLKDSLGRDWQCSTLQLDFNNPERFDLSYINNKGEKERPLMLHRALFGSLERFIGILIEHYAGAFPAWLAPVQARVLTVSDQFNEHAHRVRQVLQDAGIRAEFIESHDKLGAKIRLAQLDKIPFMLIVGEQEVTQGGASIRSRAQENEGFFAMGDLVRKLTNECQPPV